MTSEEKRQEDELKLISEEIRSVMSVWRERQADPIMVCTMMIAQFTRFARPLFEDESSYNEFVEGAVNLGKKTLDEGRTNARYIQ